MAMNPVIARLHNLYRWWKLDRQLARMLREMQ